jgi:plastocyanin
MIELLLLAAVGISLADPETIAFAGVVAVATAWSIWRRSLVPVLARALVFADVALFMAPATVSNLAGREHVGAIVSPMALAVTSIVGLVATAGHLRSRRDPDGGRSVATATALGGIAVALIGTAAAFGLGAGGAGALGARTLEVTTHGARFSTTNLAAAPGPVTIDVANDDLFWHTLTIDQLGVDIRVPVKAHRSVTFNAPAGTYTYRCAIPGHESIGMKGTLTVR